MFWKTVVGNFENMMFLLNNIAINFEFLRNDDVGRVFKVFQDTPSQQAQTERVITIRDAGGFDFSMCAFDFLFVEKFDCILWLHGGQFCFTTTEHEFSAWFDCARSQAGGHQDFAFDVW